MRNGLILIDWSICIKEITLVNISIDLSTFPFSAMIMPSLSKDLASATILYYNFHAINKSLDII